MRILHIYTMLFCGFMQAPEAVLQQPTRREIVLTALGALSGDPHGCKSLHSTRVKLNPGTFPPFQKYPKGFDGVTFEAFKLTQNVLVVPGEAQKVTDNYMDLYLKHGEIFYQYRAPYSEMNFGNEKTTDFLCKLFGECLGHLPSDTGTDADFFNLKACSDITLKARFYHKDLEQYANTIYDQQLFVGQEPYKTREWWNDVHNLAVGTLLHEVRVKFAMTDNACVVMLNQYVYLLAPVEYVSETELKSVFQSNKFLEDYESDGSKEFTILYASPGGAWYELKRTLRGFKIFSFGHNHDALPGQDYEPHTGSQLLGRVDCPIDSLGFA